MKVRAKFWVSKVQHMMAPASEGDQVVTVELRPVMGEDNGDWSKYTPDGRIEMTITNPAAIDQFDIGEAYYIDFSKAE